MFLDNLRTTLEKSHKVVINQKEMQALTRSRADEGQ